MFRISMGTLAGVMLAAALTGCKGDDPVAVTGLPANVTVAAQTIAAAVPPRR